METQPGTPTPARTTRSSETPGVGSVTLAQRETAGERRRFRYTLPGMVGALVFACLSFTPSLLPRSGLFQGVVCGVTAAIGYGLGVLTACVWRELADRRQRPTSPRAWRVFLPVAALALVVSFGFGQYWQGQLRDLMGTPGGSVVSLVLLPVSAAAVFVVLVAVSRALRAAYGWAARLLGRWIGQRAARVLGFVAVAVLAFLAVDGLLLKGLVSVADRAFAVRDSTTPEGVVQPSSALRSGGRESLVDWSSLGRQGRIFTAGGPSDEDISTFTGSAATEPIRIYAGSGSADDAESRAQLAVADLQRAGGFDRAYLMVATTTGSGWLDPGSIDTFEYLAGGDSASVTMQYSHLPSWISYLVDQVRAREAGRELFDAVYEVWSKLPAAERPKLVVFGESLGSFGGETAFSGEFDLRNRTDGALFAGAPNFNTLYRRFTDDRDPGSPEVQPVYRDGRTVRFTSRPGDAISPTASPWDGTRVLYLQHPSDPIVWWNTGLILRKPDWLREQPGHDVLDAVRWIPFVSFWQVTADLPLAVGVPPGHGHTYTREYVDGWATVLRPAGWGFAKADRLRDIIQPG